MIPLTVSYCTHTLKVGHCGNIFRCIKKTSFIGPLLLFHKPTLTINSSAGQDVGLVLSTGFGSTLSLLL